MAELIRNAVDAAYPLAGDIDQAFAFDGDFATEGFGEA